MPIEFAPSNRVEEYRVEIDQLLLAIAKFMIEEVESPEDWVAFTFVSNGSGVGDFLSAESLVPLAQDLQLHPLKPRDLMVDVAMTIRQRKLAV